MLWLFRSKNTFWGDFLRAKYCQGENPITKKRNSYQSLILKNMINNKIKAEKHSKCILQSGGCFGRMIGRELILQQTTKWCKRDLTTPRFFTLLLMLIEMMWGWDKLHHLNLFIRSSTLNLFPKEGSQIKQCGRLIQKRTLLVIYLGS